MSELHQERQSAIDAHGIIGDRVVHVRGPEGVRTSRRHHNLIGLHATLGSDGEPLVDGLPWASPEALERVRAAAGADAMLARYDWNLPPDQTRPTQVQTVLQRKEAALTMPAWQDEPRVSAHIMDL